MQKIDLNDVKSIKIKARNFQGRIKICHGEITHLEYEDEDINVGTSWGSDRTTVSINIDYEKGDFLSRFFSFSKMFHEVPINLYIGDQVNDITLDLSSADIETDLDSTNLYNLTFKTRSGDVDINGANQTKTLKSLMVDTGSGDVNIDLNNSDMDELILKGASGDFEIHNVNILNGDFSMASGDVFVDNAKIENLKLSMASGDVSIKKSIVKAANFKSASGDVFVDSLDKDFYCTVNTASGDIDLLVQGKEKIYLEAPIHRYSSSIMSNVDLVQSSDSSTMPKKRVLKINVMSGDISIRGVELQGKVIEEVEKEESEDVSKGDEFLTIEEKKVLSLLKERKISRSFAIELLKELGYSAELAEKFLKDRGE
ncbi:MAG: DUF4097 family beta strand repeat-containing protein [Thermotogota bacterium]|nr:DUF4097 family beta strand repeat-containing protein [Thermotogota bacterium]